MIRINGQSLEEYVRATASTPQQKTATRKTLQARRRRAQQREILIPSETSPTAFISEGGRPF